MNITRKALKYVLDKSKLNHKVEIMKLASLKDAHAYCKVNWLSGQVSGPLIEDFIKCKYNMTKNKASDCNGDLSFTSENKNKRTNLEIKISNGGNQHNKFNYVQIRMNHTCDYLLTAYYLDYTNIEDGGELFIFRLSKSDISSLIFKYGSYAHGTIQKLGKITVCDLANPNNDKEYALRPKYDSECWNELLLYRVSDIINE